MQSYKYFTQVGMLALVVGLSACDNSDDETIINSGLTARYDVTVTNITANQVLTPLAVVVHKKGYSPWKIGVAASNGLEMLAESGDPTLFLQEADADVSVLKDMASSGVTTPGASSTVSLSVEHSHDIYISFASMLADTNDAFAGVQNLNIGDLDVGASTTALAHVHDAGTEANTETGDSIPGPSSTVGASGGFSSGRETSKNFVGIHSGVVGMDELPGSVLDESKRWLTYAAMVKVTRVE